MTRLREAIDAPELGASVELVECSVGELLPLIDLAAAERHMDLTFGALAATLHVDGKRMTEQEIRDLPAHLWRYLFLELGPRALTINKIRQEAVPDAEKS